MEKTFQEGQQFVVKSDSKIDVARVTVFSREMH